MNTSASANNKRTGDHPWSGKHEYTFWFKVVTDSVSQLWNNSVSQVAAWCKTQKNKQKNLHTEFWPLKTMEILYTEQQVWTSVKDMKAKIS